MDDIQKEELEPTELNPETPETPETPVEEPTPTGEDIDYTKELEALEETKKPQFSPQERATFNLQKAAEKAKELGIDPASTLGIEGSPEAEYVTKKDLALRDAKVEARRLSRSDGEFNLIMWYVENRGFSVDEAHLLANKGKLKRSVEEIARANEARPNQGSGAGERVPQKKETRQPAETEARLAQRGLKWNPKTGTYQGQFTEEYFDGSSWKSRKIQ